MRKEIIKLLDTEIYHLNTLRNDLASCEEINTLHKTLIMGFITNYMALGGYTEITGKLYDLLFKDI